MVEPKAIRNCGVRRRHKISENFADYANETDSLQEKLGITFLIIGAFLSFLGYKNKSDYIRLL